MIVRYREFRRVLAADLHANRANPRGRAIVRAFRLAQFASSFDGAAGRLLGVVARRVYSVLIETRYGIELPVATEIGPGLAIWHAQGTVVNARAVLGAGVVLRHNVTIGNLRTDHDCPVIEEDVRIGAGAVIVGAIRIGRGSVIGPNVVVTTDVPAGSTVFPPIPVIRDRGVRPVPVDTASR
jgi:serine acetyltransferase